MRTPSDCDGSCLSNRNSGDEITCEDGELLVFFRCIHDDTWYLTTLAPPLTIKEDC
jgi:hypothetical protein